MIRAQNKLLIAVFISAIILSCSCKLIHSSSIYRKKKYPIDSYLDSLIRNSHLVEISEIISEPEKITENGNTVYEFYLQQNKGTKNYQFAVGGNYPFTQITTNVRFILSKNNPSNIKLLKKGQRLIFYAKAIKTIETSISTNCLEIVGFVKPTQNNINYIQHTFREGKSFEALSLYHTDKRPRKEKNRIGRKEHYWTYYENGNIKRESIRLNKLFIIRIKNSIGKRQWKLFYLTFKDNHNYYYENGKPKEIIETKHKFEKKTGDKIISYDTTKFDMSGKIIYRNQKIIESNINGNNF